MIAISHSLTLVGNVEFDLIELLCIVWADKSSVVQHS